MSNELANLSTVLSQEIARNIEFYDLSIQGAVDDLKLPNLMVAPLNLRRLILFDRSATAPYLGTMRVLDATGHTVIDSRSEHPAEISYSDRDYFKAHVEQPNVGLFIGGPLVSRTDGHPMIGLSRRIDKADGSFGGVVLGTLHLEYFENLFAKTKLGPHASLTLFRADGTMLMRKPYDAGMIGKVLKSGSLLEFARCSYGGEYEAKSAIDGVARLIHFERVGTLPLIVAVTASLSDIYADWWHKAAGISAVVALCCAVIVALTLWLSRELRRRMEAEAALGRLADEDGLTGIANRRRFDEALREEWAAAVRMGTPLSLLLIDADQFKAYNDVFGHLAGDDALRALGKCLMSCVRRRQDLAARFGGEEFAVLLPSTEAKDAMHIAEAIRNEVLRLRLPHPLSPGGRFTVSVGVATASPQARDQPRSFIAAADAALYEAKHAGRNRSLLGSSPSNRAA